MKFETRVQSFLLAQTEHQLTRVRKQLTAAQDTEVSVGNQSYLNLTSNDYLGLASHPKLIEALKMAAEKYGLGSGASPMVSGYFDVTHKLEEAIADFLQFPRALIFSNGFQANMAALSTILTKNDTVLMDKLCHASLIDAVRLSGARLLRYKHNDIESLQSKVNSVDMIITDGLFSMDGDFAKLEQLIQYGKFLYVDDAHSIGVMGQNGRGSLEQFFIKTGEVDLVMGTFGKAFGSFGAFIAGSEDLIEYILQKARPYIFSTALPPALCYVNLKALELAKEESWRQIYLKELSEYFHQSYSGSLSKTHIQPIIVGENEEALSLADKLHEKNILVQPIRPPSVPKGTSRLRITLSANHQKSEIDKLLDNLP